MIEFAVKGTPVPKQSFKKSATGGYTPAHVKAWQEQVAWEVVAVMRGKPPFDVPMCVQLFFNMPTNRRVDADNLSKAVLDGMTMGGLFTDDRLVEELHIYKNLSHPDPGVVVVCDVLEDVCKT